MMMRMKVKTTSVVSIDQLRNIETMKNKKIIK